MHIDKKTLYVSDLDGTLLHSTEKISSYTNQVINRLVERGIHFSYATARSYVTSSKATAGLYAKIPVIIYNGAFILDNENQNILLSNFFDNNDVDEIKEVLTRNNIQPIVYAYINKKEKFSYQTESVSGGMEIFLDSRRGDIRENPVSNNDELYDGRVFYFTCIDSKQKLSPINDYFQKKHNCIFHKDIYSGEQWLEILPFNATKANAVLQLKEYLNCDKVISFGDHKNDIPMFQVSDECYAVENAIDELKEIATGIISCNNEDGVAKWLSRNIEGL